MPWEQRGDRRYYYRYKRVGRRAVRVYAGTGQVGEQAAVEDAAVRSDREAQSAKLRAMKECQRSVDTLTRQAVDGIELLLRSTLFTQGYHLHDRSTWRRWRHVPAIG
jgi:hypothetical protein